MADLHLLKFIKFNKNWEQILSNPPYCLKIKHDNNFVLFKYNQLDSDMSLPICQEARGIIFYIYNNEIKCVCHSFNKFFNFNESLAASLDWGSIEITEKIDGNLMQLYYYDGWHLATSGTINAFKAPVGELDNYSFGDAFLESAHCSNLNEFCKILNTSYTYFFELVNPSTQVTIPYGEKCLYLLGARNMDTDEEINRDSIIKSFSSYSNVRLPEIVKFNSISKLIDFCKTLDSNHEGFVAKDKFNNRVKFKGDEYLRLSRMLGNGPFTLKRYLEYYNSDSLDDFYAYTNEYNKILVEKYNKVINSLFSFLEESAKNIIIDNISKKELALKINDKNISKSYLFKYFDTKISPKEYFNSCPLNTQEKLILSLIG